MKNKKLFIVFCLAFLALIGGVLGQLFFPNDPFPSSDIPIMFIAAFLTFLWYRTDTEELNYRRSLCLNVGIIALGILAFPYYFIRSRGLKKGFVFTLIFLMLVIGWSILQSVGAYLVYFTLQS